MIKSSEKAMPKKAVLIGICRHCKARDYRVERSRRGQGRKGHYSWTVSGDGNCPNYAHDYIKGEELKQYTDRLQDEGKKRDQAGTD